MSLGATDKQRSLFLKGFNLSKQGNYEDPTYLGFKIVVDFGSLPINADDGLPPSPLFKKGSYFTDKNTLFGTNPFGQEQYSQKSSGNDGDVAYYSAISYLEQREFDFINGGKRADALKQFGITFSDLLTNSPWFIQSITGLDEMMKVPRPGYQSQGENAYTAFNPQRTAGKVLEFTTLESLNLRMTALADLYNTATFDYDNMRELLPRNLRKFTMYIFVSEIRNFFKTSRLIGSSTALTAIDDLSSLLGSGNNPGSNLGVIGEQNTEFGKSNFSPSSVFNSFVGNVINKSGIDSDLSFLKNQQDTSGIKPMLVFECRNCEFDFTESTPLKVSISNGSSTADPEGQKFKIHVGKVRMRNQYPNIRTDGKPLIIGDGWDSARTSVQKNPINSDDIISLGGELLTNFISNSVNDLINEGVASFIKPNVAGIDKLLMGNVYSFNPSELMTNLSYNSAQNFLNGLSGVEAGFKNTTLPNPQSMGLGGPAERVYPAPKGDVYPTNPGKDLGLPERVYKAPIGDVYPTNPGKDLGIPERIYSKPAGDVYPTNPGPDLGVPDRIYSAPSGDVYPTNPGPDLGVPSRVYPVPAGDVYPTNPGPDLGVPDRIYPAPSGDVYPTNPGPDLGVPDRIYSVPSGDVYPTNPGPDLGAPERIYRGINDKAYDDKTIQRGSIDSESVYTNGDFNPYPVNIDNNSMYTKVSKISSDGELRDPSNTFTQKPEPVYKPVENTIDNRARNMGRIYPTTIGDFIAKPPIDLGNLKPDTKYNISTDGFNSDKNDFV
jgi:hypothetical protein